MDGKQLVSKNLPLKSIEANSVPITLEHDSLVDIVLTPVSAVNTAKSDVTFRAVVMMPRKNPGE